MTQYTASGMRLRQLLCPPTFILLGRVVVNSYQLFPTRLPTASTKSAEKYAQIRFLTNACVDTMVDYFKGNIDLSLDEVGGVIIDFLNKMKK